MKIQIYPWYEITILPLQTVKFLLLYNHTKIYGYYIEGVNDLGSVDLRELSLVLDVVLPPKFKMLKLK